jgi:hypothetical protein
MGLLKSRSLTLRGFAVLTAFFATLAVLGTWGAAPAQATSYRFWSYWLGGDGDWSFSSQGASRRPTDGTVDGWRFAVSEASSSTIPPRHSSSFGRICGSTDAVDGSKRIGLVVDFGTTSDAPDGETPGVVISTCVVAPVDANGYDVLDLAGVQLRTNSGLICGFNGYPATECGVVVADPAPSPTDDASGSNGGSVGTGPKADANNSGGGSASNGGNGTSAPSSSGTGGASSGIAGKSNDQRNGDKKRSTAQQKSDQSGSKGQKDLSGPNSGQTAVAVSPAAAAVSTSGSGSPVGLAIGLGVVAALLAAAYVLRRRRV